MEVYKVQLIETFFCITIFLCLKIVVRYIVRLTVLNDYFKKAEKGSILKLINLLLLIVFFVFVVAIWSVKQENILIFASSIITVLGVALFAEMSILSNVTACLILFFQHTLNVGDTIILKYEGNEIEGELIDITYFFVYIKASDQRTLTIPNALLLKNAFWVIEKNT